MLVDRNTFASGVECPDGQLVVFTTPVCAHSLKLLTSFEMAPWTEDDWIEYLAATHRGRCAAVLQHLQRSPHKELLFGLPHLWRIVLDVMAAYDSITDIHAALRWHLGLELADQIEYQRAAEECLGRIVPQFFRIPVEGRLDQLLRHRVVRVPLAAQAIATRLCHGGGGDVMIERLPEDLLVETARLAASNYAAEQRLRELAESSDKRHHSTATSILHQIYPGWRPSEAVEPDLSYARLPGARWEHLKLPRVHLVDADLRKANLEEADLERARAQGVDLSGAQMHKASIDAADFRGAVLRSAQMTSIKASWCDFANAVMERADMSGGDFCFATFVEANLRNAILAGADLSSTTIAFSNIEGAVLRCANLSKAKLKGLHFDQVDCVAARFTNAVLDHCNLEGVELPGAEFERAFLSQCLLTDSFMPGANFRCAKLGGAGLAGIEWPGADLRDADLTHSSFHLGSSRSGLVGSSIPCEGSKTGFYTDEFNDQTYKRPEEIRKANLCGADLRGANVAHVDFYLVDLRGARLDPDQREHAARCGAILSSVREYKLAAHRLVNPNRNATRQVPFNASPSQVEMFIDVCSRGHGVPARVRLCKCAESALSNAS
jgi:uncharacterized protein YjbI with pentapeptide repeats